DLDDAPRTRARGDDGHARRERLDDGQPEALGIGALNGEVGVLEERPLVGAFDRADGVHGAAVGREAVEYAGQQPMLVGPGDDEGEDRWGAPKTRRRADRAA